MRLAILIAALFFTLTSSQAQRPAFEVATVKPAGVRGQLGLKLESTKGPVEVIVVDGVQKPSEN